MRGLRAVGISQIVPPIDAAHPDLPTQDQSKQEQFRRLRRGQRALRLDPSAELLIEPLNRVGALPAQAGPQALPLARGKAVERQQVLAGFLQALNHLGQAGVPRKS